MGGGQGITLIAGRRGVVLRVEAVLVRVRMQELPVALHDVVWRAAVVPPQVAAGRRVARAPRVGPPHHEVRIGPDLDHAVARALELPQRQHHGWVPCGGEGHRSDNGQNCIMQTLIMLEVLQRHTLRGFQQSRFFAFS